MSAARLDLSIFQGDYFSRSFKLFTQEGEDPKEPKDLTGLTFEGHIRSNYDSNDFIPFDIDVDLAESTITIFISSPVTAGLKPGNYVYDVEIIENSDHIFKVLYGTIEIKPEVTK